MHRVENFFANVPVNLVNKINQCTKGVCVCVGSYKLTIEKVLNRVTMNRCYLLYLFAFHL